jgi:hypothetical protein
VERFVGIVLRVVPVLASVYNNRTALSLLPIKAIESNLPQM